MLKRALVSGYCQKADAHLAMITVREAWPFSAKQRQPFSVPIAEKEAWSVHFRLLIIRVLWCWWCSVDRCLKMCGLDGYGDAVVGSLGVEVKKRTTIRVELVAKVCAHFDDELVAL